MKIRWSPLAIARVSEIAEYIAHEDPAAAERWAAAIFDRVKQVRSFDRSGRSVPEVAQEEIRELLYRNYRIIYRIESGSVSMLTVRHFKQILPIEDIENAWQNSSR